MLLVNGVAKVWAVVSTDNIKINPSANGSITATNVDALGDPTTGCYRVTLTASPNVGYGITANDIIVKPLVDPSSTRNDSPGIAGTLEVSGSNNVFYFDLPERYDGALVTATFTLQQLTKITKLSDIKLANGNYEIDGSFTWDERYNNIGTSSNPFAGILDGKFVEFSLSDNNPLFESVNGAIIKNVIISSASVSTSGDAGAIANKAEGATRIYNCGVKFGSVSGSGDVGSIVGKLDNTSRVINCYSFADVSGGSNAGGIVGNNKGTTTAASITTMVMNCMFYGDIKSGTKVSPIYCGTIIDNLNTDNQNTMGLNNFNYYAYENAVTFKGYAESSKKYNCALAVEEKYLNRFEFYRLLLNSNRKLAAYYATGFAYNADQMAKWVLESADNSISSPKPYPILKAQGKYPSIINIDADHATQLTLDDNGRPSETDRNKGGKIGTLEVNINIGSGYPTDAAIKTGKSKLTLNRTDKDENRFNFNYDKIQLPYYNDVGTKNYTENKVVTGWKITAIDAVTGDPYTSTNYPTTGVKDYPDHNYADRKSSNKDKYSVSGRVFSQGAYFDVPYGVKSITIEPYWGNAAYVADEYLDVVSKKGTVSGRNAYISANVESLGKQFTSQTITIDGSTQTVYTSITDALGDSHLTGSKVYDNAVVLVGNLHQIGVPSNGSKAFTMMSVDLDEDNEPDYSLIYCDNNRKAVSPIRFDFLNIPGMAQAQKPNGADILLNAAIFKTMGWFEITNTALMYFTQYEYENGDDLSPAKSEAPLILLGGYIDQFVSTQGLKTAVSGKTIYIHVGGNVFINSFGPGTHSDGSRSTVHVPVSVTGGDYNGFYLTGTYNQDATISNDNAKCYISGGRFGELAGAAQEQIGSTGSANKGNIHWQIYDADITNFFGGGINDKTPAQGNITTDIFNSHVATFCGGPKFGNMATGKTVTTNADGCTFDKFFGAGYGGNSFSRKKYTDVTSLFWDTFVGYYTGEKGKYYDGSSTPSAKDSGKNYGNKGPGVATDFDYELFPWTSGQAGVRFFVKFVSFSLAQCNDVNSNLTNCTIKENFYGGGSLGKVTGTATSVLDGCKVSGNAFGAGYSATLPTIPVRDGGFAANGNPNFNTSSGMYEPGVFSGTTDYTWTQVESYPSEGGAGFDGTKVITTQNLAKTNLGSVGTVVLTIKGDSKIGTSGNGDVYGGGDESVVTGNITVNLQDNATINGNVFGGGNNGAVGGSTTVNIEE